MLSFLDLPDLAIFLIHSRFLFALQTHHTLREQQASDFACDSAEDCSPFFLSLADLSQTTTRLFYICRLPFTRSFATANSLFQNTTLKRLTFGSGLLRRSL